MSQFTETIKLSFRNAAARRMGGATASAVAPRATVSAEARRAKVEGESDTHHARNDRDGFREGLNPSYELLGSPMTSMRCSLMAIRSLVELGLKAKK